jgi:hypothetical protein
MTPTTKAVAGQVQRSLRDLDQWPLESLERLAGLYQDRGERVLCGLVRAEIRTRQAGRSVLPLGESTLFDEVTK